MATIYPSQPQFADESEQWVYDQFLRDLPKHWVSYFHYNAGMREFDVALLIPDHGIVILEIKGWRPHTILEVKDNNQIIIGSGGQRIPKSSPLKQARTYVFQMMKKVRNELQCRVLVIPVVCYPNLSEQDFQDKGLYVVSEREQTLLRDDFENNQVVMKLENQFTYYQHVESVPFDQEVMLKIRGLFEPPEQIMDIAADNTEELRESEREKNRTRYSHLQYIPAQVEGERLQEITSELLSMWEKGTKILLVSESENVLGTVRERLKTRIVEINLDQRDDFSVEDKKGREKSAIFQFFFHKVKTGQPEAWCVIDGKGHETESVAKRLLQFSMESDFNWNQYQIEHARIRTHIEIKAGAGSGKTFSMISRLQYLMYAEQWTPEKFRDSVVMVTFTREAAHNMKRRLQKQFENYYLLTKDFAYFRMIEMLEDLRVSTIHSLAKRILRHFAPQLGMGNQPRIVNGTFQRRVFLTKALDQHLKPLFESGSKTVDDLRISMYNLRKRIQEIFEKLNSKNVDVLEDGLNFGRSELPVLDQTIEQVLQQGERDARDDFFKNDQIPLSELMIQIKKLVRDGAHHDFHWREGETDEDHLYVFVDEFQDTDNVQIELLKEFQRVLGFSFFVVGDLKQCIYRFRGAEDQAFSQLTGPDVKKWGLPFSLNQNYRSDARLLEQFESIFERWGQDPRRLLEYKSQDRLQSHIHLNDGLEIEDFYKAVAWKKLQENDGLKELKIKFQEELQRRYEQLGEADTLAILVRVNSEVELIRQWGEEIGRFVETDHGGRLFQSEPTLDLYKLVLALQKPTSPAHLLNLYASHYVREPFPKQKVLDFKQDRAKLLELFAAEHPLPNWATYLDELKYKPVMSVLRKIILDTKPWGTYVVRKKKVTAALDRRRFRESYKRNLDLLFEKLVQLGNGEYLTINRIESNLRNMIVTRQSEESRDDLETETTAAGQRIVCKTVHKAKGLEYHTVLMPFMDRDLQKTSDFSPCDVILTEQKQVGFQIRLDERIRSWDATSQYLKNDHYKAEQTQEKLSKLREETRILYVAMTRAIRNFVYFYEEESTGESTWQSMIRGEGRA